MSKQKEETIEQGLVVTQQVRSVEKIGKSDFDMLAHFIDSDDAVKVEESAEYFEPLKDVPYIVVVQEDTKMKLKDDNGDEKLTDGIFFLARAKDSKDEPKRYVTASTILVRQLQQNLNQYGAGGSVLLVTHTGEKPLGGGRKVKEFSVQRIVKK